SGSTTLGTVAALGGALLVSFGPLVSAIDLRSELAGAGAAFTRIFALLDLPVDETPRPATTAQVRPSRATGAAGVELRLDGVWFSYDLANGDLANGGTVNGTSPGDDLSPTWTLRGVDLRVAAGTTAAVVGASGAGKTTITYLASGIYRPQRGAVTLDGVPLADLGDRLAA
nr:ATP-binding cassette domain-containing protein [Micromonospora sp. DSM 115978]